MAKANIEPAKYECPVCNDYFKKPKLLLCGHVLCRDCLLSWLQSNREALCPLCRCSIIDAQVKAENSLGDMVDMLPDDVAMEALVESAKIINTNHICFLHADKAAVAICLQCRESYCQNCSEPHKKSSATRHHHVEDLSTLTAEKLAANRQAVCTTHGDKTAELFCSTHHIPICQVCALLEHRDCCDLLDLKKRADVARGQLEQLLANLTSAELSLKESTSKLDQIESNLEKNTQTVTHSLEETQNYLQRLAKICNQHIAEVYKSNSENKNKIRIAKEDLLKRHGKAVSHKLVVKRVQQTISGSELFNITTKLKACIGDLVLDATLPADLESFTVPGFTFDVKVLASLEDDLSHFRSLPASVTKQYKPRMSYPQIKTTKQQLNHMPQQFSTQGGTAYPSLFYSQMAVPAPNPNRSPSTDPQVGISNPTPFKREKKSDTPFKQEKKSAIIIQDAKDLQDVTDEILHTHARSSSRDAEAQEINDLQWLENDAEAPLSPPLMSSRPTGWVADKLTDRLREKKTDNEKIFDWIESNLSEEEQKSKSFIRELMTAVCQSAISGTTGNAKLLPEMITTRKAILLKYLENRPELDLQALFALQALVNKLEHPPGLLRSFFDALYDEEIISEETFTTWEKTDEQSEGKAIALLNTEKFFVWLREGEEDS